MRRYLQVSAAMIVMALGMAGCATIDAGNATTTSPADAYRQAGEAKIKADDFAGAVAVFNQWVAAEPKNAEAWQMRGRAKDDADDYAGAIADCDQALKLDPTDALAYYWRGRAKDDANDYAGAVADFNRAIELNPKNADYWHFRGAAKGDVHDFSGALVDLNRAVELDPKDGENWFSRGLAKVQLDDNAGAIADFNRCLELDPTAINVYHWRGVAKLNLHADADAVADLNRYVKLKPKDAQGWFTLGMAKISTMKDAGNFENASTEDYAGVIGDFDKSLALDPTNAELFLMRGMTKAEAEDYEGARDDLNQALKLHVDADEVDRVRAALAAIEYTSSDKNTYWQAAAPKLRVKDYAGALVDLNHWVEADPKNADAWLHRGLVKFTAKDFAGAIADYDKSLELNPNNALTWYDRGVAKIGASDNAGALADLNQFLKLDPTDAEAYYWRAGLKRDEGDFAGARGDLALAMAQPHNAKFADKVRDTLAGMQRFVFPGATINGQPANLELDTGSVSAMLTATGAKRLRVKVGSLEGNATMDWFDKKVPLAFSQAVLIGLGKQVITAQMPVGNFSSLPIDGFIGWDEVQDNILVFDPAKRTVRGAAKLPAETAGWLKLAVRDEESLILETPLPDGKTGAIEIDTGDSEGVHLAPAQWKEWTAAHPDTTTADKIELGALVLTNVPVEEELPRDSSADFIARLGIGALERMDLVVDAKGGFAYVKALPPTGPSDLAVLLNGGNNSADDADSGREWTVGDSVKVAGQEVLFFSVKIKRDAGDFDGAEADAEQAYKLYPQDPDAKEWLEGIHLVRGMDRLNNKKDYDGAIADFTAMIELDPKDTGRRMNQGDHAASPTESDSKKMAITFGFNFSSKIAAAYVSRGMAKMKKGNNDEAIADFNQALVFEKDPSIYMILGVVKQQQGDATGATADLKLAQAADPKNSQVYMMLGAIKDQQGDHAGAIDDLNHAAALDPKNGQILLMLGMIKGQQSDYAGAIATLNQLISVEPQNVMAYIGRGGNREANGDIERAITDYNRGLELDPQSAGAYAGRGGARQIQGNFTGALADYDKDIALNDDPSEVAMIELYRQSLLAQLGQPAGDLTTTMANWKSDWYKDVGEFMMGDMGEKELLAAATEGKAKDVPSQQCAANYFIGMARLLKGDSAGAREAFQKALAIGDQADFSYQLARAELARMDAAAASTAH